MSHLYDPDRNSEKKQKYMQNRREKPCSSIPDRNPEIPYGAQKTIA